MSILTMPNSPADLKRLENVIDAVGSGDKGALSALGCSARSIATPRAFHNLHGNGSIREPGSTPAPR